MADKLLLHSCCAPCSSVCLERLTPEYEIFDYYYNPNITEMSEYEYRENELKRLIDEIPKVNPIHFVGGAFDPEPFFNSVKGFEDCPERGDRCTICFKLRLMASALKCKELGCDMFATTLTLSPLKDADLLNSIGEEVAKEVGVTYLPSNFKKKNGYLRSIELSREYNLYRQSYCGCVFSKRR
ncbi:MAG: epoxyqueuosine reductase QueH [Lachnospiraceae bacterium]|nr:epoxyqueuosine reductase QueH [Lachnospiraceae bacterium]